ncbi:MAG: hypothetical protein QNJ45_26250 [Ardenticatenaceae bacterium]|nr:hypothetical protein [Ardenticatenaceae bacterium]
MAVGAKHLTECPNCGSTIRFRKAPYMEQTVECAHCETELVVVNILPLTLDWAYEYDDDWDDDDWDDDD